MCLEAIASSFCPSHKHRQTGSEIFSPRPCDDGATFLGNNVPSCFLLLVVMPFVTSSDAFFASSFFFAFFFPACVDTAVGIASAAEFYVLRSSVVLATLCIRRL